MRTFDVADEIETARSLHHFVGRLGLGVAFGLLLPDVENRHAGIGDPQHALGIDRADQAVLVQHFGLAVDVQTHVQQQGGTSRYRRYERRNGGTDDSVDRFDDLHRTDHHRSRAAGRCEALDGTLGQVCESDRDARIRLLLECLGGVVAHLDDLGRGNDFETVGRTILSGEDRLDTFLVAEEYDLAVGADLCGCHDGSLYGGFRCEVAAHSV